MYFRGVKGVAKTFDFPLIDFGATDFVASVTIASGDARVMKDDGAWATTTNLFVDEGEGGYSIALTATEMNADRIMIKVVDQTAPKEWEDQSLVIDNVLQGVGVAAIDGSTSAATRLKLLSEFGSYPDGLVVVDTNAGAAGTTDYENGTMLNPVLTFADAISIAGSIPGIRGYMSLPDTTILLSQDFPFTLFQGVGWTLQTAGYDLSNAYVSGAFVDGQISTSDVQNANFSDCILWGHTAGSAVLRDCAIANDFTLGETNGSYTLWNCKEAGGITQAAINYNASGSNNVNAFDFTGTLEIKNMAAGDTLTIIGAGSLIIAASCTGGTITRIGGAIPYTDNSGGAVAITATDGNYTTALGLQLVNYVRGRKVLSKTGFVWSITVYDHTDDVTPILVKAIKDYLGNDIDDLVAKQLAMELKSSV